MISKSIDRTIAVSFVALALFVAWLISSTDPARAAAGGTISGTGGRGGTNGITVFSVTNLTVNNNLYVSNIITTNISVNQTLNVSNIITTNIFVNQNLFVSNIFATNIFATNIYATNIFVDQSITVSNVYVTNIFGANARVTNLYATNIYATNLFVTNITVFSLLIGNPQFDTITLTNGDSHISSLISSTATSAQIDVARGPIYYYMTNMMTNIVLQLTNMFGIGDTTNRTLNFFFNGTTNNGPNYTVGFSCPNPGGVAIRWGVNSATNGNSDLILTNSKAASVSITLWRSNVVEGFLSQLR